MTNILFLVHRLPYPLNKSDKVRSFHLLKHLAGRHRIYLGAFIDDPDDERHVDALREFCAEIHVNRLSPISARIRSVNALLSNDPLVLHYYRDGRMLGWVQETCRTQSIDAALIVTSPMAQYVQAIPRMRTLIDFIDVDSARWTQLARSRAWPKSWLSRREGERLLAFERLVAARAARSFFVTRNESELFRNLAPECAIRVETLGNGVDSDYFSPDPARLSPFSPDELPIVFSGDMEYLPNVDAVVWFASDVLPRLEEKWPQVRFHVVGRKPRAVVRALAGKKVVVTGTVADIRPYLQHAAVVVAPLRVARGVKNGVLEAMAMACPVIASGYCAEPIDAVVGEHILTAITAADFVQAVEKVLQSPLLRADIGNAARQRVLAEYKWNANLASLDNHIDGATGLGNWADKRLA